MIGRFDGAQKWMERKDPKRTIIEQKKCCLFSTISSTVHDKEREKEMCFERKITQDFLCVENKEDAGVPVYIENTQKKQETGTQVLFIFL